MFGGSPSDADFGCSVQHLKNRRCAEITEHITAGQLFSLADTSATPFALMPRPMPVDALKSPNSFRSIGVCAALGPLTSRWRSATSAGSDVVLGLTSDRGLLGHNGMIRGTAALGSLFNYEKISLSLSGIIGDDCLPRLRRSARPAASPTAEHSRLSGVQTRS